MVAPGNSVKTPIVPIFYLGYEPSSKSASNPFFLFA